MFRKPPYFIICIFLSALISIDAFAGDNPETEACSPDSVLFWKRKAVECERDIFEGCSASEANGLLFAKAEAYRRAGMPKEAEETLRRVRVYLLDENERSTLDLALQPVTESKPHDSPVNFKNLTLSAASAAWIVLNACSGLYVTGFLGGGIVLYSLWWPE